MQSPRTRRVQRVHLAHPLAARLGTAEVRLVDLSVLGARVEHLVPLSAGAHTTLTFDWEGEAVALDCRIVRSRIEHFSVGGADGATVYHSGLEFHAVDAAARARLKSIIGRFIGAALEEQKLNARGVMPEHGVERMPIFRFGGQLTANVGGSGYVCYALEHNGWRRKRTHDPGQPVEGFTISAMEDHAQAELLCDAYVRSDPDGRRLIQLCAQLSIIDGEGAAAARFEA